MRVAWLTVPVCLAALAFPAHAAVIKCVPPGDSAADQYYETIPGGSCNAPPPKCGAAGVHPRRLSPAEVRQLDSEGAAGRAVPGLVSSSAPPRSAGPSVSPTAAGANPVVALGRLMFTGSSTGSVASVAPSTCPSSGSGASLLLPILLAVALAGAIAAALMRRNRAQPSPAQ